MSGWLNDVGNFLGTNTSSPTPAPKVDPNAFNYGGQPGAAAAQQGQYSENAANAYGAGGRTGAAPTINNAQQAQDQNNAYGTYAQQNGLANTFQGMLDGTGPNLAQAQMNASTDQSISAQMAMANSSKGGLASALASRNASQMGASMQQNAAQQSMIGTIQQQQMAAGQLNSLYNNQGQLALGEQNLNQQNALAQAQLQAGQNQLNQGYDLGEQGLSQQLGIAQMGAQMSGQQLLSSNQLASQGQGLQQGEFNAGQNQSMFSGALAAGAGALMMSDMLSKTNVSPAGASSPANPDMGTLALNMPPPPTAQEVSSANQVADQASLQQSAQKQGGMGAMMSGFAQMGAGAGGGGLAQIPMGAYGQSFLSDEDAKTRIPGGLTDADRFLASLKPATYQYRDPRNEPTDHPTGDRYLGIMAQDVAKSPTGGTIVKDTPRGKAIEQMPALSAVMAGLGRLNERLSSLERGK